MFMGMSPHMRKPVTPKTNMFSAPGRMLQQNFNSVAVRNTPATAVNKHLITESMQSQTKAGQPPPNSSNLAMDIDSIVRRSAVKTEAAATGFSLIFSCLLLFSVPPSQYSKNFGFLFLKFFSLSEFILWVTFAHLISFFSWK